MRATEREKTMAIRVDAIAPCGMNCRLCWAYIRDRNRCPGCLRIGGQESQAAGCRTTCRIRNCEHLAAGKGKYCSDRCDSFPCARLKRLDKRYRTKYGMSMIANLRQIAESGIRQFVRDEKARWLCPECGELICVHKPTCLSCGHPWH
jgi:hypothetical protein